METNSRKLILGVVFILVGSVLLLDNLDVLDFRIPEYLFRWEMILVIIGLVNLINRNYSAAIMFFGIGAFFWITNDFDVEFWQLWPIIFIIVGLSFIFRRSSIGKKKTENPDDYFDDVTIFGGNEKIVTSQNFQGGKATSIFGGSEIDLTQSSLQEGTTVIDVFTMFGGCEIRVPDNWYVQVEVTTILGGFEDKRKIAADLDESKLLVIKGFTMFGGGEIKN